ncbi:MAG: sigma-70 family RNA polymerase sigma factor [Bacteroidaceae bacterium]|nr:sigma-70 family RNA polymerase sigma factor [Bacteroidaceae bacterium]MBO5794880.1 sigma-70 family RNA polymerase sigma factor [Bacteroidaceae bacterium]
MSNFTAMSDHELVELYEQGVDRAFDVLLERNQEALFAYIMRLTQDVDQANDVFQETFMKAIVCIRSHQYKTTGKFSAWLMRIAHNLVIDLVRTNRNMPQYDGDMQNNVLYNNVRLAQECCEEDMLRQADLTTLEKMIGMLPPVQQEIVHLRFYEDLSFKEIAQITNVSINTALGRMRYATLNLRKMITDNSLELAV